MKKLLILAIVGIFFTSIFGVDAQAAKKTSKKSKISQEFLQEIGTEVDRLTTKVYGRALLSPQDNESLISLKIKLDSQMIVESAPELAPLYYKTAMVFRMRDLDKDAIECYQVVLENFANTAFAPKARAALIEMGIEVKEPENEKASLSDEIQ